ncbi:hypothetical protein B296_00016430 [Ensete ventricosum]|uniref:Cation/H+ exchanger domain-containing protein n=1 Tax=Ensete ventricosum TaxID=4639 RepID=A0A426YBD7_ENSVE|nr:hypothetical protein B296_00016430 [Ensete ventricosum]
MLSITFLIHFIFLSRSFQFHDVFNLDNENRAEDIPTLIDRKVVITGYLLAGSIIGPGGFRFISEMVQVGALALLPVTFSLWKLCNYGNLVKDIPSSASLLLKICTTHMLHIDSSCRCIALQLRVVRAVAIVGGFLQIALFMCLCGIIASVCFNLPSNSSSILVLKFLMEKNSINALHGQVTVGTLILQVVVARIALPSSRALYRAVRTGPPADRYVDRSLLGGTAETNELYQLASVAFCLLVAWVGMSLAQIGEFAFVLLSRASNLHLVEGKLYLLLLGTTALSLVTTPLLFKLIPAVVHLGVLLRWFNPDSSEVMKSFSLTAVVGCFWCYG